MQDRLDRLDPPTHPPNRPRQLDILAQPVGGGCQARCLLDGHHDLLQLIKRAGQTSGKAVGEQGERAALQRTVPTGNEGTGRRDPGIGAVTGETTAATGMERATRQACLEPCLLANVLLAGQGTFQAELHRPPARTAATVAGHSFYQERPLCRDRRQRPTHGGIM